MGKKKKKLVALPSFSNISINGYQCCQNAEAQAKTFCADLHFTLTIIHVESIPRNSNMQVREGKTWLGKHGTKQPWLQLRSVLGSPPTIHSPVQVWADHGTSVLTALIQTYFWSIINNLQRVNRWTEFLVTISNKLKGIKSILCFSGTPRFPIHSTLPKIIISLVNQGLFKLCANSGFFVSVSSNMSSKSCIRKWD